MKKAMMYSMYVINEVVMILAVTMVIIALSMVVFILPSLVIMGDPHDFKYVPLVLLVVGLVVAFFSNIFDSIFHIPRGKNCYIHMYKN